MPHYTKCARGLETPDEGKGETSGFRIRIAKKGKPSGFRIRIDGKGKQSGFRIGIAGKGKQNGFRIGIAGKGKLSGFRILISGKEEQSGFRMRMPGRGSQVDLGSGFRSGYSGYPVTQCRQCHSPGGDSWAGRQRGGHRAVPEAS